MRAARVYRKDGTIDEAIESGAGAMADDPSMAMYTSARSYYVHFPRLEPGDVVELQYRVEDVAQRNAFADYFGEVVYMQSAEPVARSEYVLITPKSRTLLLQRAARPGPAADGGGARRPRASSTSSRPTCRPSQQEPLQPPWTEVLGHVHVSTYKSWDEMGALVLGPHQGPARARRRGAPPRRGAHEGPEGRPREGARHLRLRRRRRRATWRWSSASTATSRTGARRSSRAASATAKTRRRSS